MTKIASIELSAFRGIRSEVLDLGGRSLFVYGENGTGKSSIIDGLEFFFTGNVSHLEGVQTLSTKRHAAHVILGSDALSVGVRFQGYETLLSRTPLCQVSCRIAGVESAI